MEQVISSVGRRWQHEILDHRDETAIEIIIADLDGDGRDDIISGRRWYRAPDWEPEDIPGIAQAIAVMDVDSDGSLEVIGTRGPDLSSNLCWAKPNDAGWVVHDIGAGGGDWPHGVATFKRADGTPAMITSYHGRGLHPPQIWTVPHDHTLPWDKSTLIDLAHSEEMLVVDLDGDGLMEIVAGPWWLDNVDGAWLAYRFADRTYDNVTRARVGDFTGNGRLDIVLTEETGDWESRDPGLGRIALFEAPADIRSGAWTEHVIAWKKCPHSLDLAHFDGSETPAIVVAEHDAFTPDGETVNASLSIFRRAGDEWIEECVDSRFEHFNGAKAIRVGDTIGIVSHGWMEPHDLHLWTPLPSE